MVKTLDEPKTLDQIVQDHLGALQFIVCRLEAENEKLKAENTALKAPPTPTE